MRMRRRSRCSLRRSAVIILGCGGVHICRRRNRRIPFRVPHGLSRYGVDSMTSFSSTALLAGAALVLVSAPTLAAMDGHDAARRLSPAVSSGNCTEGAAAYSVSTALQKTSARAYRDVTGTSVSFTQGAPGCVEVSFS